MINGKTAAARLWLKQIVFQVHVALFQPVSASSVCAHMDVPGTFPPDRREKKSCWLSYRDEIGEYI